MQQDKYMTVSIIVPIYNAEKYLDCCLRSIVTQSYPNLEIICVNDGSTDKSLEIIEKFAQNDKRFVVINQINSGLSVARNEGTKKSSGSYIMYVDADDFLEVNAVEVMLKNIITYKTDFVIESIWNYDDKQGRRVDKEDRYFTLSWLGPNFNNRPISPQELLPVMYNLPVMAWGKLYNADFLKNSGVKFPAGLIYEDNLFFTELFFKAKSFSIDRRQLYNYRVNVEKSITKDSGKNYGHMITIMHKMEEVLRKQPCYETVRETFINYKLKHLLRSLVFVNPRYEFQYFHKIKKEFQSIDLFYYDEAKISTQYFYPLYCCVKNDNYLVYKYKKKYKKKELAL